MTNTPDVLNDEVADTTIGLLLNTIRRLPVAETYLREGRWEKEGPFALTPLSLKKRHVGLLGLGRIGLEIAKRLEPFKVKISYHTRTPRKDVSYTYAASVVDLAKSVDTLIPSFPRRRKRTRSSMQTCCRRWGLRVFSSMLAAEPAWMKRRWRRLCAMAPLPLPALMYSTMSRAFLPVSSICPISACCRT